MKSTQDKFRLVTEGKMFKKDFLKEMKQTHKNVIHQTTTYNDAVRILKNRNIIIVVSLINKKLIFPFNIW
mgnify:CR=1 FL=1